MPVTAAKTYIKQPWNVPSQNAGMLYDMVKWLTDEHSSITGPAWTVVTADDGSRIDQPGGGDFLANIDSGNDWSTGNANTPLVGAWVCLESLTASTNNGTNHFQFILRATSSDIEFYLIQNENFSIPGATTSLSAPTVPADSVGPFLLEADATVNVAWLNMCADEGMLGGILDEQAGSVARFFYVGELDEGHPSDTRPYVLFDRRACTTSESNTWLMLAAQDGVTPLDVGRMVNFGDNSYVNGGVRKNLLGVDPLMKVGAACWDSASSSSIPSGFVQFRGWCRNIRETHEDLANHGTLDSLNFLYANSDAGSSPGLAIVSDGVTVYP